MGKPLDDPSKVLNDVKLPPSILGMGAFIWAYVSLACLVYSMIQEWWEPEDWNLHFLMISGKVENFNDILLSLLFIGIPAVIISLIMLRKKHGRKIFAFSLILIIMLQIFFLIYFEYMSNMGTYKKFDIFTEMLLIYALSLLQNFILLSILILIYFRVYHRSSNKPIFFLALTYIISSVLIFYIYKITPESALVHKQWFSIFLNILSVGCLITSVYLLSQVRWEERYKKKVQELLKKNENDAINFLERMKRYDIITIIKSELSYERDLKEMFLEQARMYKKNMLKLINHNDYESFQDIVPKKSFDKKRRYTFFGLLFCFLIIIFFIASVNIDSWFIIHVNENNVYTDIKFPEDKSDVGFFYMLIGIPLVVLLISGLLIQIHIISKNVYLVIGIIILTFMFDLLLILPQSRASNPNGEDFIITRDLRIGYYLFFISMIMLIFSMVLMLPKKYSFFKYIKAKRNFESGNYLNCIMICREMGLDNRYLSRLESIISIYRNQGVIEAIVID